MNRFNHESGRYLEVSGASIYYETLGNKENPVLVMLHGGFENIENLNSMVEYLVDDFYIIGIDARGHGKSTLGTDRMTYTLLQKDVECLLKHLKVDIANILGFSDGGIVAYRIAASGRIQVNKLITIGASWRNADIDDGEEALKSITPQVAKEIFQDNYDSYEQLNPEPDFNRFTKGIVDMWPLTHIY